MNENYKKAYEGCILVEVERGVVCHIQEQGVLPHPIRVLVRDHDNLKFDPKNYQDAEWKLG